jgi:hypothetical protein
MNKELDLKIEDLFRWTGKVEITDQEGKVIETLYQRVVGDAEIQKARVEALKASKILRKALRDENSDEYLANMPLEGDFTIEELVSLIAFSRYSLFKQQAEYRVDEKKVKEPKSDADLEAQEEYISKLEEEKKNYEIRLAEDIKRQTEKLEEELKQKDYSEVFNMYRKEQTDIFCRVRMMEVFEEFATFYGTFSDEKFKSRRFETVEQFRDLSPRIKAKLIESYRNIELNLGEVKK